MTWRAARHSAPPARAARGAGAPCCQSGPCAAQAAAAGACPASLSCGDGRRHHRRRSTLTTTTNKDQRRPTTINDDHRRQRHRSTLRRPAAAVVAARDQTTNVGSSAGERARARAPQRVPASSPSACCSASRCPFSSRLPPPPPPPPARVGACVCERGRADVRTRGSPVGGATTCARRALSARAVSDGGVRRQGGAVGDVRRERPSRVPARVVGRSLAWRSWRRGVTWRGGGADVLQAGHHRVQAGRPV